MGNGFFLVLITFFLLTQPDLLHAKTRRRYLEECKVKGKLKGKSPKDCNTNNDSDCCVDGKLYLLYDCSPPVTSNTLANMTLNSFTKGGDGGGEPACGGYYPDTSLVVALSTGWFNDHSRCNKTIRINGNGRSVVAKVVDECDSMKGCDSQHAYQPPCRNNVVDASAAVWRKLGYTEDQDEWGETEITWSDA